MKNNVKKYVSLFVGLLLLAAALFIGGSHYYKEEKANRDIQGALEHVTAGMNTGTAGAEEQTVQNGEQNDLIQDTEQSEYVQEKATQSETTDNSVKQSAVQVSIEEMTSLSVGGRDYIGVLALPTLGLQVPIIDQLSDAALDAAPCRFSGSVYTNDLILAGHNYANHFGKLDQLKPGDRLNLTMADGETITYKVLYLDTLDGDAVEEMTTGQWDLTLFTCTQSGMARVTVRCRRVGV